MPTEEYLTSYLDAWNRHDVDAIMAEMTGDAVWITSAGSRIEGAAQVRQAFAKLLEKYPNARWKEGEHFASGSRGGSECLLLATSAKDGSVLEQRGCDLFTFRDGKIAVKDSYLK